MYCSDPLSARQQEAAISSGTSFGTEVANYSEGRKPYPVETFQWIKGMLPHNANVLDMACGSGKATIDLREYVTTRVTGLDIDKRMLEAAKKTSKERHFDDISYFQGDARTLLDTAPDQPSTFRPGTFDAITVCSAIHWIVQAHAVDNLYKLLKPLGKLIIVGGRMGEKDNTAGNILGRDVAKQIISQTLQKTIVSETFDAADFDADAELKKHHFVRVETKDFQVVQEYTFQEACAQVKSVSFFAALEASDKKRAWPALEAAVKKKFVNGTDVPLRIEKIFKCFQYKSV